MSERVCALFPLKVSCPARKGHAISAWRTVATTDIGPAWMKVIPEANARLIDVEPEAVPAGSNKGCNTQACCQEKQDSKQAGDDLQAQI